MNSLSRRAHGHFSTSPNPVPRRDNKQITRAARIGPWSSAGAVAVAAVVGHVPRMDIVFEVLLGLTQAILLLGLTCAGLITSLVGLALLPSSDRRTRRHAKVGLGLAVFVLLAALFVCGAALARPL